MENQFMLRQEELINNPTARVPVCLVLDVSGSMSGDPIKELNSGVQLLFDAIKADEIARYSAEICIVTFGDKVEKVLDFMSIDQQIVPPLKASGYTPMGEGVSMGLDLLDLRKGDYQRAGVDYYQPWLVIMTDGEPTDDILNAANRIKTLVTNKKLAVFPIAIGESANLIKLKQLAIKQPLRLNGLNFKEFFVWLSRSISNASNSIPGETIVLDVDGIKDWAKC